MKPTRGAWSGAERGDAEGDGERRLRGWRRRWIAYYVGFIVLILASGSTAIFVKHRSHPSRPTHWTVFIVLTVVLVSVLIGGAIIAWKVQTGSGPTRKLLMAGDRRSTRRTGVTLRKGQPLNDSQRDAAQALVDVYQRRTWLVWLWIGLGVLWLAQSLGADGFTLWLRLALGLFYLGYAPYWWWFRTRLLRNAAKQGIRPGGEGQDFRAGSPGADEPTRR